jgi:hypothetical protein
MNKTLIKRFKGHKLVKNGAARWRFFGKEREYIFHTAKEAEEFIDARGRSNVKIAA